MNENQPPEEISDALRKASKLRAMIASPGWQDIILPDLLDAKKGHEQRLLTCKFESLEEVTHCQYSIKAIDEFLGRIKNDIDEATEIEKESAIEEATAKA